MLQVNHNDVRHSAELRSTNAPDAKSHARYIDTVTTAMQDCLGSGQTVVVTGRDPVDVRSIKQPETLITLRVPRDLEVYRNLYRTQPEALPFQFLQGQLAQAMAEVNMNANGQQVRPIREGNAPSA